MSRKSDRNRVREIELARQLETVLNTLPYEITTNFCDVLLRLAFNKDNAETSLSSSREKRLRDRRRLDLVLPLTLDGDEATQQIVFETKLGPPSKDQIDGYINTLNESSLKSTIISIATTTQDDAADQDRIGYITWTDLFTNFLELVGGDARQRILGRNPVRQVEPSFRIDPPKRSIGNVAEVLVEEFLNKLIGNGLVEFNSERLMVATGDNATKSTTEHDLYFYPDNWNHAFKFLAIVYHKKLQYVGRVLFSEQASVDEGEYNAESIRKRLQEGQWSSDEKREVSDDALRFMEKRSSPKDHFLILERLETVPEDLQKRLDLSTDSTKELNDLLKRSADSTDRPEYQKKGPMTQSHRYYDNLVEFLEDFNTPDVSARKR